LATVSGGRRNDRGCRSCEAADGIGISSRREILAASASSTASAARCIASSASSPKVATSGRSGQVTRRVPLSSGVRIIVYMESLRRKRLIESQILFDLVDEASAQLLAATVHRQLRAALAPHDGEVAASALVTLERAALFRQPPPKL